MLVFVVRRIGTMILTMLVVSILLFLTLEFNSENVAVKVLGPYSSQESREIWLEEHGYAEDSEEEKQFNESYREEQPYPYATFEETMAHFWHVIDLVGIDHVGIGSDYDGVGDSLPEGLKDVSTYPAIVATFEARGFSEHDIAKVLGGNAMRVWSKVVEHASGQGAQ